MAFQALARGVGHPAIANARMHPISSESASGCVYVIDARVVESLRDSRRSRRDRTTLTTTVAAPMSPSPETRNSLLVRLTDRADQAAWHEFAARIYMPVVYRLALRKGWGARRCRGPRPAGSHRGFQGDRPLADRPHAEIPHLAASDRPERNHQRPDRAEPDDDSGWSANAGKLGASAHEWGRFCVWCERSSAAKCSAGRPIKFALSFRGPTGKRSGCRRSRKSNT